MNHNLLSPLEKYTQENPQVVLLVHGEENGEGIEIIIFRGFSSCLTGATEFDPDLPVLSSSGQILSIDCICSPYNPDNPQFIEQNLSPVAFAKKYL